MSPWQLRLVWAAAALGAGVLAALAHPPFGFLPGFLGYPLLLWLLDRSPPERPLRSAFWRGWLAGFAYFFIGCWWVAEAFLVDARQAWMAPFAASLLPAGLGLFWGAAAVLYRRIAPSHVGRVLVFAAALSLFEWLRGHVLTGFPWNLPGATWTAGGAISQTASLIGVYGLTALTLFVWGALAPLAAPGDLRRRIGMAAAGAAVLALLWAYGAARLSGAVVRPTDTVVRIVQPHVPQQDKWNEAEFRSIVQRYLNLTARQPEGPAPDVVIWPEGALPAAANDVLAPGTWTAEGIAAALRPGQTLLMGAYRAAPGPGREVRYYNSLVALRTNGPGLQATAVYDKHRLVPFGEYMPLDSVMDAVGIKELTHVGDGFSAGPRPAPMRLPGIPPVQPLICYESLFPGLADSRQRPAWIVNVSNDAWFGRTSGPLQHLNLASYRAIELGTPIVRSTPTGVSGVVDPWGRIDRRQRLDPGESGVIDAPLPAPAENTYFSRIGDLGFWVLAALGFLVAAPLRQLTGRLRN